MQRLKEIMQSLQPPTNPTVGSPQADILGDRAPNTPRSQYLYLTHRALTGKLRRLAHHILPLHDTRTYRIPNIPPQALIHSLKQFAPRTPPKLPKLPLTQPIYTHPSNLTPGPILQSGLTLSKKLHHRDYTPHLPPPPNTRATLTHLLLCTRLPHIHYTTTPRQLHTPPIPST